MRKSISHLQPAALPSTGSSCSCCDSKPECHGKDCETQELAAWTAGYCAQLHVLGAGGGCPRSVGLGGGRGCSLILCFSSSRAPCCSVVLGTSLFWTQKHSFCRETREIAPPLHANCLAQLACTPVLRAAFQLPPPPEDSIPVDPAGREYEVARDAQECPGIGHVSRPGLPSLNSSSVCILAWPGCSRPGQRGLPPAVVTGCFWGWKTETSSVFSRLPGF